jgi:hypothetical protein
MEAAMNAPTLEEGDDVTPPPRQLQDKLAQDLANVREFRQRLRKTADASRQLKIGGTSDESGDSSDTEDDGSKSTQRS